MMVPIKPALYFRSGDDNIVCSPITLIIPRALAAIKGWIMCPQVFIPYRTHRKPFGLCVGPSSERDNNIHGLSAGMVVNN